MPDEIEIVKGITGADRCRIQLRDDGFMSRGYVIDGGRIVFKFRKNAETTYIDEVRNLRYLNGQDLGINMQEVAYESPDDTFLGLYGVPGTSLEQFVLTEDSRLDIGQQLGRFLRKLHSLQPETDLSYPLDDLISAWQTRYARAKETLAKHFDAEELVSIDLLMMHEMPETLRDLGERNVFSHGDLGDGNILIDADTKIGVIDFSSSGYMDEASDFMDVTDDEICSVMLETYGADNILRKKVEMQRRIRPVFVLDAYAERDDESVQKLIEQIRLRNGLPFKTLRT